MRLGSRQHYYGRLARLRAEYQQPSAAAAAQHVSSSTYRHSEGRNVRAGSQNLFNLLRRVDYRQQHMCLRVPESSRCLSPWARTDNWSRSADLAKGFKEWVKNGNIIWQRRHQQLSPKTDRKSDALANIDMLIMALEDYGGGLSFRAMRG